jgi:hypothetical protein
VNAATGRLVELIAKVAECGGWEVYGIKSLEHWVTWKCGVSPSRAKGLVDLARRFCELPATRDALVAGELTEDQAKVVCAHVPAHNEADAADLARMCTVSQLRHLLSRYSFSSAPEPADDEPAPEVDPAAAEPPEQAEPRRFVSFAWDEDGTWGASAALPGDEGARVERALTQVRDDLFHHRHPGAEPWAVPTDVSWADALVAMAESALAGATRARPHGDRHLVLVHLGPTAGAGASVGTTAQLHLGPALPDAVRRHLGCDARARVVHHDDRGVAVSVGRSLRIVPERTRVVVEHRDGGCRVPGCGATRWLQVHHIRHWEDGGSTDTANLLCLCSFHHRLHHRGRLGITGDADAPPEGTDAVVFTDERGRRMQAVGRPAPPGDPPAEAARRLGLPVGRWDHPIGERLDGSCVVFQSPPASLP